MSGAGAPIAPRRMDGRRAFVTGGGSGIGRATALRLAAEGAAVAIADIRTESAMAVASQIETDGGQAIALSTDVGSEASVEDAVASAADALGGLDTVFANAGTAGSGWLHELTLDDWETVLRINLTGTFPTAPRGSGPTASAPGWSGPGSAPATAEQEAVEPVDLGLEE